MPDIRYISDMVLTSIISVVYSEIVLFYIFNLKSHLSCLNNYKGLKNVLVSF